VGFKGTLLFLGKKHNPKKWRKNVKNWLDSRQASLVCCANDFLANFLPSSTNPFDLKPVLLQSAQVQKMFFRRLSEKKFFSKKKRGLF